MSTGTRASSSSHTGDGATSPLLKKVTGWSAKENSGAAAGTIRLTDGNGGTVFVHINLAASESANMNYDVPIYFASGCHVDEVSGDITIVVHGTIS